MTQLFDSRFAMLEQCGVRPRRPESEPKLSAQAHLYELTEHNCHRDPTLIILPPFLVTPLNHVPCVMYYGKHYYSPAGHDTYWVDGAILTHFDWQRPDKELYREGTRREAVCAMAQFQALGSVRVCDAEETLYKVVEACFWGAEKALSLHRSNYMWWGHDHHRLWIPMKAVPACSSTRDIFLA